MHNAYSKYIADMLAGEAGMNYEILMNYKSQRVVDIVYERNSSKDHHVF